MVTLTGCSKILQNIKHLDKALNTKKMNSDNQKQRYKSPGIPDGKAEDLIIAKLQSGGGHHLTQESTH